MPGLSNFRRRLADVALAELANYGGIPETDPPLRPRIYKTYLADLALADPNDPQGWAMPADITSWAWSATFISWCVSQAGAKRQEFDFSIRHSTFTQKAIADALQNRGLFRGRRIGDYAPQIGDLIVANRAKGKITYDQAATNNNFPSHSAIVVDFTVRNGVRFAVTIGGNEGDTVGRTEVALTAAGLVKQRTINPYVCVIETLKEDGPAPAATVKSTGLPASFRGHGTFFHDMAATIADYGSIPNVVAAMQRAGMGHAWVRIHGVSAYAGKAKADNKEMIAALKTAGIAVAGWGWCQGANPKGDAALAVKELKDYGLTDYVADIEPGVNNAQWTALEVQQVCEGVRKAGLGGGLAVSSFALVDWHEPQVMKAAAPFIDAWAPQVYWFNFPNSKMVQQFQRPGGGAYTAGDPGQYADLCLDRWAALTAPTAKPLIMTGQAYWGESNFTQAQADAKLAAFLKSWNGYSRIAGLNWWHLGGGSGMSHAMLEAIVAARLAAKPYS
ncbi:DUF2272 domain-containing protein [Caulobacter sp. NIBR1757]|uniref:DUF2272 domain-containing protein n=1 Tax=Caulobacter sp. NIBR1757 TaxID=3016000 RepID=UPI0022F0EBB2|nr:DUF2272 domain-containing protein [Caulobacter sp. NIBR1757]WGM40697.1 hypothetical protein AMEJIAPC_03644 [Caulobacter sp. NIBR1757]